MIQLLRIELYKLFRLPVTKLALLAVLLIDIIALGVAYSEGKAILDFVTSSLQDTFFFEGNLLNGSLVSYLILNSMWFHIPLIVIVASGSFVASEYSDGSLRNILCRPVKRSDYLLAKYLCVVVFCILTVLVLAATSIGLSYLFFSSGDLLVYIETLNFIPSSEAFVRLLFAFTFGSLSMATFGLMAAALATFFESPITANIAALFILIVFTIIDTSGYLRESIFRNLFIVGNTGTWQRFFEYEIPWPQILQSATWLLGYCVLFVALGRWRFKRVDISC